MVPSFFDFQRCRSKVELLINKTFAVHHTFGQGGPMGIQSGSIGVLLGVHWDRLFFLNFKAVDLK